MICRVVIVNDDLRPALAQLTEEVGGQAANEQIGSEVALAVQQHLDTRNLEPSKLGGPKTNFWAKLSGGVSYVVGVDYSEVSVPAPARQKYYGGTIVPSKPGGVLVFPISASTYGQTYREWRSAHPGESAKGLFAFATKVTQSADLNTLPPDDVLLDRAEAALLANLDVLLN